MTRTSTRTRLLRIGFTDSVVANERLTYLSDELDVSVSEILGCIESVDPDPDAALAGLCEVLDADSVEVAKWVSDGALLQTAFTLMATSTAFVGLLRRHPEVLPQIHEHATELSAASAIEARLQHAIDGAPAGSEEAISALRVQYLVEVAKIALYDIRLPEPAVSIQRIGKVLADLADAAMRAALEVAKAQVVAAEPGFGRCSQEQLDGLNFAVIGFGKCGAQELNYISDIDVMFVAEPKPDSDLEVHNAIKVATRLAQALMRITSDFGAEPALWEVDAGLRPEGKDGELVRTVDSYLRYYERWAKNWEFMALLKARPMAGETALAERFVSAVEPLVWQSGSRDDFVKQTQRMRARVIEHIPADEAGRELKLGSGGLRDVEFPVQLLQLVHGQVDDSLRVASTLDAISVLAAGGYIGRDDAAEFTNDYRYLRLLEHRVQLRTLHRTHLMPDDPHELRVLARAARMGTSADLTAELSRVQRRVRTLHKKLFFRPLVAASAGLDPEAFQLASDRILTRLRAIGYLDPQGALAHIQALTQGVSRRSTMQRHLLPVLLEWFAEGTNPDQGLLAFRKLSEQNGDASWYLRLLRDSNLAARRLCDALANSTFCARFLELFPEAVQWLDSDRSLTPRSTEQLWPELASAFTRYNDELRLGRIIRALRRREVLRLALGAVLGVNDIDATARGLTTVADVTIEAGMRAVRIVDDREYPPIAIIAMGRYGGQELGFGSDLDVLYVFDTRGFTGDNAAAAARGFITRLNTILEDVRLPIDLDADLRPEGKAGELVRSLDAYQTYYRKWSLGWEAQALLRARGAAGDAQVMSGFLSIADETRYRTCGLSEKEKREIRRIKARVEDERLPRGADPKRHLKLGRGSLSDVEWLVQTVQLDHGHSIPSLRTTSTIEALHVADEQGIIANVDRDTLERAWRLASQVRSAVYLYANTQTDVLPTDHAELEGVARLLGYAPGSGVELENDYLNATRRARAVFERLFYGDEP